MERVYSTEINESVNFFIGKEIENTKFFGLNTLFIVGNQDLELIISKIKEAKNKHNIDIEHLYFAANHSYDEFDNFSQLSYFIFHNNLKVTYETTNNRLTKELLDKLPIHEDFVLMISVVISPLVETLGKNAVIKIDDTDVNRQNEGVYCEDLNKLINPSKFTPWQSYSGDIVL